MFSYYNPSPSGARVGDCAVRAVSKALGTDWETAYMLLSAKGYAMHDLPNANSVINSVLREYGFEREIIPNECPDCYTIADFARDNPSGVYVLGTGDHVVALVGGTIYDTWNSENEIPLYYWRKKEKR